MALLPPRTWPHVLGIPSSEMKVWAGESLVSVFKRLAFVDNWVVGKEVVCY